MRAPAVLFAALCLAVWIVPPTTSAAPDEKAVQRAMEQQRKAAEAEMRHQAEAEKKMMEQQNRMMQEQIKAEQKFMQNQQKAMQHQQQANTAKATHTTSPHVTTTATTTPVYHASRPYYGHQSYGHAYHRTYYRHYRSMPNQMDPETRALLRLKKSLDNVQMKGTVTASHKSSIKRALMGVVEVSRVPTIASIDLLSGHLADGLAKRTLIEAQTGPMALTLRGVMNSADLLKPEVTEIINEHRLALKASKVPTNDITPIMDSLKKISTEERTQR